MTWPKRIVSYGVRRDLNGVHLCPRELLAAEFQIASKLMLTGHHGNPYVPNSPFSSCIIIPTRVHETSLLFAPK